MTGRFLDALVLEIVRAGEGHRSPEIDTVFFGGARRHC